MKSLKKIYIETLGCPKNLSDSNIIQKFLSDCEIIENYKYADFIIINTCGFIKPAITESETVIENFINKRKQNQQIIITGCYVQRNYNELLQKYSSAAVILKLDELKKLKELIQNSKTDISEAKIDFFKLYDSELYASTIRKKKYFLTEYVKISEGCNKHCSFCVIPKIKGVYRSRQPRAILNECEKLLETGVKEIILVSQNTGVYGIDYNFKFDLLSLIKEISKLSENFRLRIMYLNPEDITAKLIELISENNNVCKYIDMPIQHTEDKILKLMNRKTTKKMITEKIKMIRAINPMIAIRSVVITGFPDETELDHKNLIDTLKSYKIDRLGVFKYSDEFETSAYKLKNKNQTTIIERRYSEIMRQQQQISAENLKKYRGKILKALIDGKDNNKNIYLACDEFNAPEIDGYIIFKEKKDIDINDFLNIKIVNTNIYDLIGTLQ